MSLPLWADLITVWAGGSALSHFKSFFFFFAFYTCGDLWPFRRANYWSRVMMFLFLLKIRVTPSKDTDNIHREEVTWAINISSRISTAVIPLRLHLLHNRADTSQLGVAHRLLLDYAFQWGAPRKDREKPKGKAGSRCSISYFWLIVFLLLCLNFSDLLLSLCILSQYTHLDLGLSLIFSLYEGKPLLDI